MSAVQPGTFTLTLAEEERSALADVLRQALDELRAERRRTDTPDYQAHLARQETVLRNLAAKMARPSSDPRGR